LNFNFNDECPNNYRLETLLNVRRADSKEQLTVNPLTNEHSITTLMLPESTRVRTGHNTPGLIRLQKRPEQVVRVIQKEDV
jgi:hypothetical protein